MGFRPTTMNRNRIYHGLFGRVVLLDMCHPLITHAHPQPHIIVKIGGADGAMEVYGRNLPLTSETVVLINAWEPHSYVGARGGPAFLLAFFLDPAWLSDLRSPRRELRFEQHCVPRTPELKRLIGRFVGHMLHDFAVERQILERLVGEITVRATSSASTTASRAPPISASAAPSITSARMRGIISILPSLRRFPACRSRISSSDLRNAPASRRASMSRS